SHFPPAVHFDFIRKQALLIHASSTSLFYTLSLHDALPFSLRHDRHGGDSAAHLDRVRQQRRIRVGCRAAVPAQPVLWHQRPAVRSEEHTSELQSRGHLVCRLLLEKKKIFRLIRTIQKC